jgi:hypothetical protein
MREGVLCGDFLQTIFACKYLLEAEICCNDWRFEWDFMNVYVIN